MLELLWIKLCILCCSQQIRDKQYQMIAHPPATSYQLSSRKEKIQEKMKSPVNPEFYIHPLQLCYPGKLTGQVRVKVLKLGVQTFVHFLLECGMKIKICTNLTDCIMLILHLKRVWQKYMNFTSCFKMWFNHADQFTTYHGTYTYTFLLQHSDM